MCRILCFPSFFVLSSVSFLPQFEKYPTKVDPFYRHSVSFPTANHLPAEHCCLLIMPFQPMPLGVIAVCVCVCVCVCCRWMIFMQSLICFLMVAVGILAVPFHPSAAANVNSLHHKNETSISM